MPRALPVQRDDFFPLLPRTLIIGRSSLVAMPARVAHELNDYLACFLATRASQMGRMNQLTAINYRFTLIYGRKAVIQIPSHYRLFRQANERGMRAGKQHTEPNRTLYDQR